MEATQSQTLWISEPSSVRSSPVTQVEPTPKSKQQKNQQLIERLQLVQHACWNLYEPELCRIILGWTSHFHLSMCAVTCSLMQKVVGSAMPVKFVAVQWPQTKITVGRSHSLYLNDQGSIWVWGRGRQLGAGEDKADSIVMPAIIDLEGKKAIQISAGDTHTACVTADGSLYAWGDNECGQLGVGDDDDRAVPTLVPTTMLDGKLAAQVSAGCDHTVCLTMDGALYSWGGNRYGQLGQHDPHHDLFLEFADPAPVAGLHNILVAQVSAGLEHTVCMTVSGTMLSWGRGLYGRLGQADSNDRAQPTLVQSALAAQTISQVSAGASHTMCVTACGLAFSWGLGTAGQLGLNDTENRLVPTLIHGLRGKFVAQVSAGHHHSVCVTADGAMFSWGENVYNQLGLKYQSDRLVPTLVAEMLNGKPVAQVCAAVYHTCCATVDGTVFSWGYGDRGQLGQKNEAHYDNEVPTLVDMIL